MTARRSGRGLLESSSATQRPRESATSWKIGRIHTSGRTRPRVRPNSIRYGGKRMPQRYRRGCQSSRPRAPAAARRPPSRSNGLRRSPRIDRSILSTARGTSNGSRAFAHNISGNASERLSGDGRDVVRRNCANRADIAATDLYSNPLAAIGYGAAQTGPARKRRAWCRQGPAEQNARHRGGSAGMTRPGQRVRRSPH